MNYYLDNGSNEDYFEGGYNIMFRHYLEQTDAKLLAIAKANQLNIQHFIYKNIEDVKPYLNQNYLFLTFPYELDDKIFPENADLNADILIANTLNPFMKGKPIYLASTDNDKCCVLECNELTDIIIWVPNASNHINTPFLIFNEDAEIFALIDYDLPLQIIGYKPHLNVEIEHYDRIQQGFNDVMERYSHYVNMPYLFRTYYDFLLPKWFTY